MHNVHNVLNVQGIMQKNMQSNMATLQIYKTCLQKISQ
jgi:hypothetical protein